MKPLKTLRKASTSLRPTWFDPHVTVLNCRFCVGLSTATLEVQLPPVYFWSVYVCAVHDSPLITFCHQLATVCKLDSYAHNDLQARQVVSDTEAEIMLRSIASSLRTLDRKMSSALYRAMPSSLAARVADIVMTLCVRCCYLKQVCAGCRPPFSFTEQSSFLNPSQRCDQLRPRTALRNGRVLARQICPISLPAAPAPPTRLTVR